MRRSALVLLLPLAACAGHTPPPVTAPPPAGMASLTVMRASQGVWGAALDHSVSIDGQPVGRLRPGGTVTLNVEPGPRVVGVDCGGTGPFASSGQAVVRAEPGRSYVVRTFGSMGGQCVARIDPQ